MPVPTKSIQIEKRHHRGEWQIFLDYDYVQDRDIDKAVRQLPNRKYSSSSRQWYVPYTKASYNLLKQLPFTIEVVHQQTTQQATAPVEGKKPNSGTTAEIRPKGDNNGISNAGSTENPRRTQSLPKEEIADGSIELTEEQAVDSSTDQDKTTDTPGIQTTNFISQGIQVQLNAKWLTIKLVYDRELVNQIKQIKGAWWRAKSGTWMLKPLPENVEAVQKICAPFGKTEYERAYQIACTVSDPIVVEIYQTPEFPTKMAVKIRGYGVSTEVLKSLPGRSYDKSLKRWLLPRTDANVERLVNHYSSIPGVKIKNRLTNRKESKPKAVDYASKQSYLINKYPNHLQNTLKLYTDALIRMRYSWKTVTQYTGRFGKFLVSLNGKAVSITTTEDVNNYLSSIAKQRVSESLLHATVNAIKFYYEKVVFDPSIELSQIKRPKKSHRLPTILSIEEVDRMLRSSKNLKHTAILYLLYSSGLRLNEMLSLKLADISWDRNQLFVRSGKGKKDRAVMLSETLKRLLTLYFDQYQPKVYLFNGQDGESPYSSSSVQAIVKKAAHEANINRKVTPHVLRHCFATHLMESGTDVRYIQELLGHKDIKTTLLYTHVTNKSIEKITSPLDALNLNAKKPNTATGL